MAKKKSTKRQSKAIAATKRLVTEAGKFVEAHGGAAAGTGEVHIVRTAGEKYRFMLCVRMVGKLPPEEEPE